MFNLLARFGLLPICIVLVTCCWLPGQQLTIPPVLEPWKGWVTWDQPHTNCPRAYDGSDRTLCFWPSQLSLTADAAGGKWEIPVTVFEETWIPLPGSGDHWPTQVTDDNEPVPVVEREGVPSVRLAAGVHRLRGTLAWDELPQRIKVPERIGVMALTVEGNSVSVPHWDTEGYVWLKRLRAEETDKDLLAVKVYRVIADGVPVWLDTELELTVSGKSREEQLGWILPQGWHLAFVESPIPIAVENTGRVKAQVRAGTWTIQLRAFRTQHESTVRYADGAQPVAASELIALQSDPRLRVVELEGVQPIDVNQTTFPARWRQLPVHDWNTANPFRIVEKIRGMGTQHPEGLTIQRQFWLDEDGRGITYRDTLTGQMQQIWRLDAAEGHTLGAVRMDQQGQLITTNPQSGAAGFEVRDRNLNVAAIGRIDQIHDLAATGWQTDADHLHVSLVLPPGWRVLALLGADKVSGDWLTAWTLLDLFLLLVFSISIFRMWGPVAGCVALVAFALSYHEPGSPRLSWFFLLIPLALLRVVTAERAAARIRVWRAVAIAILLLNLAPFIVRQVQALIYPQLETAGLMYESRGMFRWLGRAYEASVAMSEYARETGAAPSPTTSELSRMPQKSANLLYAPSAKVQTGPAEPEWNWNQVGCSWTGPVSAAQRIRPILISVTAHRALTVVRLVFLLLLVAILCGLRGWRFRLRRPSVPSSVALLVISVFLCPTHAAAQIPDKEILDALRDRLLRPSDAFPQAAEIPSVALRIRDNNISMEIEIHAAADVAVPLPGQFPTWSPISVQAVGGTKPIVCRQAGYLWVNVPRGVHTITVDGRLMDSNDWEWTYMLKPRRVTIDAPDWNVTGLGANGIPEQQVFLTHKQKSAPGEAAYDQPDYRALVAVERRLEIGLAWKVHNVVTRLTSPGRAISLQVPLLPSESVLSSHVTTDNGLVDVRLAVGESEFTWESDLPIVPQIRLAAAQTDAWVERWRLVSSPVWNFTFSNLPPIFEDSDSELVPSWYPWPGEEIVLDVARPEAVPGETITIQRVAESTELNWRQRTSVLKLELESSLGRDLPIELDSDAMITSVKVDGRVIPVRQEGGQLIVPVHPGRQTLEAAWTLPRSLEARSESARVSLPLPGANITTVVQVPESRWILWASGPLRGPAVQFWTVLACAILMALVVGRLPGTPLNTFQWMLLAIGLTQVHVVAAMLVVSWLFLLVWRGKRTAEEIPWWRFNLLQVVIVLLTTIVVGILIVVVGEGLVGSPEMFIRGNGSTQTHLQWFEPRVRGELPVPTILSVSVWYYRLAMLCWALWLAGALLNWLKWGWTQFSRGGTWMRRRRPQPAASLNGVS